MLNDLAGVDEAEVGFGGISDCGDVGGGDGIGFLLSVEIRVDEIANFAWGCKETDAACVGGHDEEG